MPRANHTLSICQIDIPPVEYNADAHSVGQKGQRLQINRFASVPQGFHRLIGDNAHALADRIFQFTPDGSSCKRVLDLKPREEARYYPPDVSTVTLLTRPLFSTPSNTTHHRS
ncbi:MAG: hypothetical protein ACLTSX_02675 [Collinsella sp.]